MFCLFGHSGSAIIDSHDKVMTCIKEEGIVIKLNCGRIRANPSIVGELDLVEVIICDFVRVDLVALFRWDPILNRIIVLAIFPDGKELDACELLSCDR